MVCLNGRIVESAEARISAFDRGFLYGDALFETMRAYGGKIFRLDRHFARLNSSAAFLGFDLSAATEPLDAAVGRTLAESKLSEAYVRLTVSRGTGRGLLPNVHDVPTVMIEVRQFSPYPATLYERGMNLVISRYRRDESSPLSNHKITNYLPAILAKREAAEAQRDDALLLNNKGDVAEATVANVFIVRAGLVITPAVSAGILPGVTRAAIMELCRRIDIPCVEHNVSLDQLFFADEVFLTNTLMEIMPVRRAGDGSFGSAPGPITRKIADAHRQLVKRESEAP